MEPTLDVGQRVLVNRFLYRFAEPDVGDIVVFHPPTGATIGGGKECGATHPAGQPCPTSTSDKDDETNFIKRIVAGPGDTLSISEGTPVVNGVPAEEDFTRPCRPGEGCNFPEAITIPPDHYFMMGDNRGASDDSRFWGPIPKDWIIGKAFATYWPPKKVGVF